MCALSVEDMAAEPYNPADDGFPAKLWECLRRNSQFRECVDQSLLEDEEDCFDPEFAPAIRARPAKYRQPNKPADCALALALNRSSYQSWPGIIVSQGISLDSNWREIGSSAQSLITASVIAPPAREIQSPAKHSKRIWDSITSECRVIAIPRDILNLKHRKKVLKSIESFLPKAVRKTQWTKPSGRTLGTRRQWRAFLETEMRVRQDFDRETALALTAHSMYGDEADRADAKTLCGPKAVAVLVKNRKKNPHFSTVARWVIAIEGAIESVFPKFQPLDVDP